MWDKVLSMLGGNLFAGVTDLVKAFKLPPEQQIQFEQAMAQMQATLQVTLEKVAADDRNSARQREMVVKDSTPSYIAYGILAIFAAANLFVFTHELPKGNEMLISRVLGTIDMAVGLILGYYYGTSVGSMRKTELLNGKDK